MVFHSLLSFVFAPFGCDNLLGLLVMGFGVHHCCLLESFGCDCFVGFLIVVLTFIIIVSFDPFGCVCFVALLVMIIGVHYNHLFIYYFWL
jgi:hypothetical protein